MEHELLTRVALCYQALYVDVIRGTLDRSGNETTQVLTFIAHLKERGIQVNQELRQALCTVDPATLEDSMAIIDDVLDDARKPSRTKELQLFTRLDLLCVFKTLLTTTAPLDSAQKASLKRLLIVFNLPVNITIERKEVLMMVLHHLLVHHKMDQAQVLVQSPKDILRYLGFEKTGRAQMIEPKTLVSQSQRFYESMFGSLDKFESATCEMKKKLKLKYSRKECQQIASLLNSLPISAPQAAKEMHPKRELWVRYIRALRLGEYSRRKGYNHLAEILDIFYKQDYRTWQGQIDRLRRYQRADDVLMMLKQEPGKFAKCLFSTLLRFGCEVTLNAFCEVVEVIPTQRLLLLSDLAPSYFDTNAVRCVHSITGVSHTLAPHPLLSRYSTLEREKIVNRIQEVIKQSMSRRFYQTEHFRHKVYIAPQWFDIPISAVHARIIQDSARVLHGTRFHVTGNKVRFFLQWGQGLHAQHLDIDLSCDIAYPDGHTEVCDFYTHIAVGALHSRPMWSIPEMSGTAEYIELDIAQLVRANAQYITFYCNSFFHKTLSPNLFVGWMQTSYPMNISEKKGATYNMSCVQQRVKVGDENNLDKGIIFGVLTIASREITWLEIPFNTQKTTECNAIFIESLLRRLRAKISMGELLNLKVASQGLELTSNINEADEAYPISWAMNTTELDYPRMFQGY